MNELKKIIWNETNFSYSNSYKIGRCNRQQQIYRNYDVKYTN